MKKSLQMIAISMALLPLACGGGKSGGEPKAGGEAATEETASAETASGDEAEAAPAETTGEAAEPAATEAGAPTVLKPGEWADKGNLFIKFGDADLRICGVGASTVRMPAMARNQAQNNARAAIAKFLEATVHQVETDAGSATMTVANSTLSGVSIIDTRVDDGGVSALACMPLDNAKGELSPEVMAQVVAYAEKHAVSLR